MRHQKAKHQNSNSKKKPELLVMLPVMALVVVRVMGLVMLNVVLKLGHDPTSCICLFLKRTESALVPCKRGLERCIGGGENDEGPFQVRPKPKAERTLLRPRLWVSLGRHGNPHSWGGKDSDRNNAIIGLFVPAAIKSKQKNCA